MATHRSARDRIPDTEKITINLGHVDLGRIDLMVAEGFYSNRTDFIRTAIRTQLTHHGGGLDGSLAGRTYQLGLHDIDRTRLEAARASQEMLQVKVVGLVRIAPDVTPELARDTIASISVLGALQASAEVKAALAGRIT